MKKKNVMVSMDKIKFCVMLKNETEATVRKKLGKGFYCRRNIFNSDSYIIEFNPNKVLQSINSADSSYMLKMIIQLIKDSLEIKGIYSRIKYISRVDFAIDVNSNYTIEYMKLSDFYLSRVKRIKKYENTVYFHTSNKNYSGVTLAIYNKSLESNLDDNIIRYEFRFFSNRTIKNHIGKKKIFLVQGNTKVLIKKLLNDLFCYEEVSKNKYRKELRKLEKMIGYKLTSKSLYNIIDIIDRSQKLKNNQKKYQVSKFKQLYKNYRISTDTEFMRFVDEQKELLLAA